MIENVVVESGTLFPTSPVDNQLFQLTAQFDTFPPGVYKYSVAATAWTVFDITDIDQLSGESSSVSITLKAEGAFSTGLELVANKSMDVALGTSDMLYPTQRAVKTYVDTVAEPSANKSTNIALGTSDVLYPSQNAVKAYVDNHVATMIGSTPVVLTDYELVVNKSIDPLLGTSNALYPTQNAVKTYVDSNLTLHELLSNKSVDGMLGTSDVLYPSQRAVKTYVDQINSVNELVANKSSNVDLGTSNVLYPTQNAVKTYVDTLKTYVDLNLQGLDPKASCHAATTGDIVLSGIQVVDGITTVVGRRYLVKNQTVAAQNGIYVCDAAAWTRAVDADNSVGQEVSTGMYTFVEEGVIQGATGWNLITTGTIVLGTTALAFSQFGAAINYIAGTGININGTVISATAITYTAGSGITITGSSIAAVPYTAGTGISIASNQISASITYSQLASKPTTLAGFGITDAVSSTTFSGLPNDIAGVVLGKPVASQIVLIFDVVRACTIPINLTGTRARAFIVSTGSAVFSIQKNGVQFCTITFAAGSATGVLGTCAAQTFVAGDYITIVAPAIADATIADIGITLMCVLS